MSKGMFTVVTGICSADHDVFIEILLATLLLKFEFAATNDAIVWNLSQIISPSVQKSRTDNDGEVVEEQKGLPLIMRLCSED